MDVVSDEPQILRRFTARRERNKGSFGKRDFRRGRKEREREQDVESQAGTSLY